MAQEEATFLSRASPRDKNNSLQNQLLILLLGRVQPQSCHFVLSVAERLFLGVRHSAAGPGPRGGTGRPAFGLSPFKGTSWLLSPIRQTGACVTPKLSGWARGIGHLTEHPWGLCIPAEVLRPEARGRQGHTTEGNFWEAVLLSSACHYGLCTGPDP